MQYPSKAVVVVIVVVGLGLVVLDAVFLIIVSLFDSDSFSFVLVGTVKNIAGITIAFPTTFANASLATVGLGRDPLQSCEEEHLFFVPYTVISSFHLLPNLPWFFSAVKIAFRDYFRAFTVENFRGLGMKIMNHLHFV